MSTKYTRSYWKGPLNLCNRITQALNTLLAILTLLILLTNKIIFTIPESTVILAVAVLVNMAKVLVRNIG